MTKQETCNEKVVCNGISYCMCDGCVCKEEIPNTECNHKEENKNKDKM